MNIQLYKALSNVGFDGIIVYKDQYIDNIPTHLKYKFEYVSVDDKDCVNYIKYKSDIFDTVNKMLSEPKKVILPITDEMKASLKKNKNKIIYTEKR